MRVAAVQLDSLWQDPIANLERLDQVWLPAALGGGAQLVILPEMFATGFSMDAAGSEDPDGPIAGWMRQRAADHTCWIGGSLAVRAGSRSRNRFLLVGPDGTQHVYDKRHPFTYAGEDREFEPGDDLVTFDLLGVRVTPLVCYDLRFADDFWRTGPSTDLFVVVANWPAARREHWRTLLRARAIENQCYVVGVNRVGTADGLDYSGDSAVIDPLGRTICEASEAETVLFGDIDPNQVASTRQRFPFLADRRAE